jgi:peptide chain release factor 2
MAKEDIQKKIEQLEATMGQGDFWADKDKAQATIREIQKLKDEVEGAGAYDRGDAILTIFSGAGGDDAEDFSAMLYRMYAKYCQNQGWSMSVIDSAPNSLGGYRNITVEINASQGASGKRGVYGTLRNESGVHRLVRQSPFNSKGLRQTSFSLVEVVPKLEKAQSADIDLPEKEIEISIAKSGGPGGQNVNKRETAVRIVHVPTKLSVHVTSERSQAQNKEKAIEILKGKLYKVREDERKAREKGLYISKTTSIEWGNQIRSYVLHPYKMVKDHRTDVETSQADKVLEGDLDEFIEAEKDL